MATVTTATVSANDVYVPPLIAQSTSATKRWLKKLTPAQRATYKTDDELLELVEVAESCDRTAQNPKRFSNQELVPVDANDFRF